MDKSSAISQLASNLSISSYLVFNCTKIHQRKRQLFNPLSPDIKIHFPLAVLHTFIMELVSGICLNIKTSYPG